MNEFHPLTQRHITVAVLTFHRIEALKDLLPLLENEAQRHMRRHGSPTDGRDVVNLLVVDNDPQGSAHPVVAEYNAEATVTARYVTEGRPGISAARNRALDESAQSDLLVFIDDDETPQSGWISALVTTHDRYHADAVAGPVVSRFDDQPDPWVVAGGFFDRAHHRGRTDGSILQRAATNNLLLDLQTVRRLDARFDDAYGLSGGEDSLFTGILTARGARIHWSADATVVDHVPASRLTREYALKRSYDLANSSARVELELSAPGRERNRRRLRTGLIGGIRVGLGLGQTALGYVTRSRSWHAHGRRSISRGRGTVAAAFGRRTSAYGLAGASIPRPVVAEGTVWVAHPSSDLYGSDLQLVETVRGLREAGFPVVVMLPTDGPLSPLFVELGAEVRIVRAPVLRKALLSPTALPRFAVDLILSSWRLRRLLRSAKPGALLVNTVTIPSWLVAGRASGVPILCHVHEAEADQPLPVRIALAAPLLLAHQVVTNSEASGEVIRSAIPRLHRRISLVYNGIAAALDPSTVRHRAPDDHLGLVLVGRLSPRKGTDVALEALAQVRAAGVDASITLCGSVFPGYEWYEEQLRRRAAGADLAGHVTLLGYVPSPASELAAADVVLVPSRVEPFGNAAVEALLARRPLIASRTQGLREIVRDEETGLLVTPGDAGSLAAAICRVANDPQEAAAMAERGLCDATERFSVQRYRRDMVTHVQALRAAGAGSRLPAPRRPR